MEVRNLLQSPILSVSNKQKREYHHHSINGLPDEVLILILSHMTMKEAARTSILSHQWERLWTYSPCLVFDGSKQLFNFLSQQIRGDFIKALDVERVKYVNEVNCLLKSHHASAIDEFRIRFDLDEGYQSDIDEWVRYAFGKEVKVFALDLSCHSDTVNTFDSHYKLRSMSILGLKSPVSLTSLVLKQVNVSGEVVENLVSNNPFLRCLCVGGSKSIVDLRVAGGLTYVEIIRCDYMKSLELDAPNLLSLKYTGEKIEISFVKIPKLVELCMGEKYVETLNRDKRLPLIHTFAAHLQKLVLKTPVYSKFLRPLKKMRRLKCPELTRLKQLELSVLARDSDTLLALSSVIDASPLLNRLALEIHWFFGGIEREMKEVISHHYNLKVIEITGFIGRLVDIEFCRYLIKTAVRLEKMSIDPLNSMSRYPTYDDYWYRQPEIISASREHAERLRSEYGLGDRLVIL